MDLDAFAKLEFDGWQRVAEKYESAWSGLTRLFIPHLIDAAQIRPAHRVLDVASGPGYVAEAVAAAGAVPVGIDFSPEMVKIAQSRNSTIDFRIGDAQELDFPDGSFDAVLMNFGLLHLPKPDAALAEAFRVLRPGGAFAFTLWAGPESSEGASAVESAITAHVKNDADLPDAPDYYGFGNEPSALEALAAAGFSSDGFRFKTVVEKWKVPNGDFVFEAERDAGVRTAALLAAQTEETLQAIRADITSNLSKYECEGGLEIPFAAHVVGTRK